MMRFVLMVALLLLVGAAPAPKPVPQLQAIPQPYRQVSFQRDGTEIARFHFAPDLRRPFLFPIIGPSGRCLTRMGHPHDPESHSHHNSVWISHNDVNGVSFWDDRSKGRIIHQRIEGFEDLGEYSSVTTSSNWVDESTKKVLLQERRRTSVQLLPDRQWWLIIDLQLQAPQAVTFGKTPFGLIGVRMAKTIGVNDGGGTIRNSEGQVNEQEILWKPAKWVDYSGPILDGVIEGITLMDHPSNPNHPSVFHVRGDGWMGSSLTFNGPRTIEPGKALALRYGLLIHSDSPTLDQIDERWKEFAATKPVDLTPPRK